LFLLGNRHNNNGQGFREFLGDISNILLNKIKGGMVEKNDYKDNQLVMVKQKQKQKT